MLLVHYDFYMYVVILRMYYPMECIYLRRLTFILKQILELKYEVYQDKANKTNGFIAVAKMSIKC